MAKTEDAQAAGTPVMPSLRLRGGGCGGSKGPADASDLKQGMPPQPKAQYQGSGVKLLQHLLTTIRTEPMKLSDEDRSDIKKTCEDILAELEKMPPHAPEVELNRTLLREEGSRSSSSLPGQLLASIYADALLDPVKNLRKSRNSRNSAKSEGAFKFEATRD